MKCGYEMMHTNELELELGVIDGCLAANFVRPRSTV